MRIPSGTTDQYLYFVALDATDRVTRETGLSSFTVHRARNGAALAAMDTPTIAEVSAGNAPGVYSLLLDEDMTIGSGNDSEEMVFHIAHAGMAPVTRAIELYRPKVTAGNTLGVESDGDLTKVNTLDGHTAQTGDSYARLGSPAGASIAADIAAGKTVVDAIKTVTDVIPDSGAMTSIATAAAVATVAGYVDTEVAAILAAVGFLPSAADVRTEVDANSTQLAAIKAKTDNLPASPAATSDIPTASEINAEIVDALATDTYAEPGQEDPPATASLATKIGYLFKAWRNKREQTATEQRLYNDAGDTVDQKSTCSDDGTTFTRGEMGTGA